MMDDKNIALCRTRQRQRALQLSRWRKHGPTFSMPPRLLRQRMRIDGYFITTTSGHAATVDEFRLIWDALNKLIRRHPDISWHVGCGAKNTWVGTTVRVMGRPTDMAYSRDGDVMVGCQTFRFIEFRRIARQLNL